jgi:hypothetical protein
MTDDLVKDLADLNRQLATAMKTKQDIETIAKIKQEKEAERDNLVAMLNQSRIDGERSMREYEKLMKEATAQLLAKQEANDRATKEADEKARIEADERETTRESECEYEKEADQRTKERAEKAARQATYEKIDTQEKAEKRAKEDREKQLTYCIKQSLRFANMLAADKANPKLERVLQFGYQQGRITALNEKNNLMDTLGTYNSNLLGCGFIHKSLAIKTINNGIGELTEENIMQYGFAIGYLQESSNESHEKWWKSIAPLVAKNDWSRLQTETEANAFDIMKVHTLDWNLIKEDTMKNAHNWGLIYDIEKEACYNKP